MFNLKQLHRVNISILGITGALKCVPYSDSRHSDVIEENADVARSSWSRFKRKILNGWGKGKQLGSYTVPWIIIPFIGFPIKRVRSGQEVKRENRREKERKRGKRFDQLLLRNLKWIASITEMHSWIYIIASIIYHYETVLLL